MCDFYLKLTATLLLNIYYKATSLASALKHKINIQHLRLEATVHFSTVCQVDGFSCYLNNYYTWIPVDTSQIIVPVVHQRPMQVTQCLICDWI